MKFRTLITVSFAAIALTSSLVRAQDTTGASDPNQAAGAVDASTHSRVRDDANQEQQPELPKDRSKVPTSYSRWAFQVATYPPVSRFGPVKDATAAHELRGKTQNPSTPGQQFEPEMQPTVSSLWPDRVTKALPATINPHLEKFSQPDLSNFSYGGRNHGPEESQSLSWRSQAEGLSSPFSGKHPTNSFSSPFPQSTFHPARHPGKTHQPNPARTHLGVAAPNKP
jgi:hypothetical protein